MIFLRIFHIFTLSWTLYEVCTSAVSPEETGNALVGCAACQGLTVKDFKCNVNCEVLQTTGECLTQAVTKGMFINHGLGASKLVVGWPATQKINLNSTLRYDLIDRPGVPGNYVPPNYHCLYDLSVRVEGF